MSVLMTLRTNGDPVKLEKMVADDPGMIRAISDDAKKAGCIAHRFYGSDDGQILVLELRGSDAPYGRPSNEPFTIDVGALRLSLPVH